MNVLFVCTGNTCRSVMAEYLLKQRVDADEELSHVQVKSAGIAAAKGSSASKGAARALQNRQLSARSHKSQLFTLDLANWAHLILTMTTAHKQYIMELFPAVSDKIFTLKEYIQSPEDESDVDIADPFGGIDAEFEACAAELESAVDHLIRILRAEKE